MLAACPSDGCGPSCPSSHLRHRHVTYRDVIVTSHVLSPLLSLCESQNVADSNFEITLLQATAQFEKCLLHASFWFKISF